MRPLPLILLALSLAAAIPALFAQDGVALAAVALAALAALASAISPRASAFLYALSAILISLSRVKLAAPLVVAGFLLAMYDLRLLEIARKATASGYDKASVESAAAKAELAASGLALASIAASYALYYLLIGAPRLPQPIALAVSAIALVAALVVAIGVRPKYA
ncbi:MAG: hypothetical protein TU35_008510 [Thermoproteus sp. AZ2]|uniref:Uncharacterized protein n=1 Tax=Thermoproteus sp. AZ2 TaxID=1609232 RepID=A0ACC6V2T8_9CREN